MTWEQIGTIVGIVTAVLTALGWFYTRFFLQPMRATIREVEENLRHQLALANKKIDSADEDLEKRRVDVQKLFDKIGEAEQAIARLEGRQEGRGRVRT